MNVDEYERLYRYEDRHWWFVARRELGLDLLRSYLPQSALILDVGCGAGAAARDLASYGTVVACDVSDLALAFCRRRGLTYLTKGDLQRLPTRMDVLDCVVALDVLEHVADDARALSEVRRALKPGGILVLTTPAYPLLWSGHDVALHHHRRYTKARLRAVAAESGLEVVRLTHAVFLLFPFVAVPRLLGRLFWRGKKAGLWWLGDGVNRLLLAVMRRENRLLRRMDLPWGLSLVLVARK